MKVNPELTCFVDNDGDKRLDTLRKCRDSDHQLGVRYESIYFFFLRNVCTGARMGMHTVFLFYGVLCQTVAHMHSFKKSDPFTLQNFIHKQDSSKCSMTDLHIHAIYFIELSFLLPT